MTPRLYISEGQQDIVLYLSQKLFFNWFDILTFFKCLINIFKCIKCKLLSQLMINVQNKLLNY